MATRLLNPVRRAIVLGTTEYVTTLENDFSISFRMKGKRRTDNVPLGQCLNLAKIFTALEEFKAKVKRYNERGSKRIPRPKKPAILSFYSPMYAKAITK